MPNAKEIAEYETQITNHARTIFKRHTAVNYLEQVIGLLHASKMLTTTSCIDGGKEKCEEVWNDLDLVAKRIEMLLEFYTKDTD